MEVLKAKGKKKRDPILGDGSGFANLHARSNSIAVPVCAAQKEKEATTSPRSDALCCDVMGGVYLQFLFMHVYSTKRFPVGAKEFDAQ